MSAEPAVPEISMTNTKKEMLEAYEALKESLQNQARTELKPEKAQKAKEEEKIIRSAEKAVDKEDVTRRIYLRQGAGYRGQSGFGQRPGI